MSNKDLIDRAEEFMSKAPYLPLGLSKEIIKALNEQDALLAKIYSVVADLGIDYPCDDLIQDDDWCEEHCGCRGTKPECIERWFKYLLQMDGDM